MAELEISATDRRRFLDALTTAFHTQARIENVLDDIGFPRRHRPSGERTTEDQWRELLYELDAGIIPDGYRALLTAVIERYPHNPAFAALAERYASELPLAAQPESAGPSQLCHVFIRTADEAERRQALEFLNSRGLGATEVLSTNHVTSFALAERDPDRVRTQLAESDLAWTVVPPGGATYLISQLIVQGPDGRLFRFTDVPAQQTVAELAADALAEYPGQGGHHGTVTDHVEADGSGVRLSGDATLHEAAIRDGDQLRVGTQAVAGAINPQLHSDALFRAAAQIRSFDERHPEIALWANAPGLATSYELQFRRPSFGPPPGPGQDPVEIEEHVVQLNFGPDFPMVPPTVFWITPIFHPNIYPNYDCELARANPARQGLVCLGELADAYQPTNDLGALCQVLIDLAAFRNYGLFLPPSQVSAGEAAQFREELQGNVFDPDAARWVLSHQDRIEAIGGRLQAQAASPRDRYQNVVESYLNLADDWP
jgi:hypothetical protein